MSNWGQYMYQDASSSIGEAVFFTHDYVMLVLVLIVSFILFLVFSLFLNGLVYRNLMKNHFIELVWTVVPVFMLVFIAFPSIYLLYLMEEVFNPKLTIKTLGHQWYWSYEYSDFNNVEFDSYMVSSMDLDLGMFRLLDVDNSVVLPYQTSVRMLVSSGDVLHSWAVPSASLKMDAIPGRLNQIVMDFNRPGIYYGQCSEICGANHSFMPIKLELVSFKDFVGWIKKFV